MERTDVHELTAAYALDAIDDDEASAYEEHLRHCEPCRKELAELQEAASALALAPPSALPPPGLRGRILEQARGERTNVVALRPRWEFRVVSAAAAVAAAVAVGIGLWAADLSSSLSEERAARERLGTVARIIAQPEAKRIAVAGEDGVLVVAASGESALLLSQIDPPPAGRTYQAWVIEDATPLPAGVFEPEDRSVAVALDRRVTPGSTVAVTVEPDGGRSAPSGEPLFTVETA